MVQKSNCVQVEILLQYRWELTLWPSWPWSPQPSWHVEAYSFHGLHCPHGLHGRWSCCLHGTAPHGSLLLHHPHGLHGRHGLHGFLLLHHPHGLHGCHGLHGFLLLHHPHGLHRSHGLHGFLLLHHPHGLHGRHSLHGFLL